MHVITRDCAIECLAALLSVPTLGALASGIGEAPATVGQVIELYEQRRLMNIHNISSGRAGEIKRCLMTIGLIEAEEPAAWSG